MFTLMYLNCYDTKYSQSFMRSTEMPTFTVTTNMRRKTENGATTDMPICALVSADDGEVAIAFFKQAFKKTDAYAEGWRFIGICRASEIFEDELDGHRPYVRKLPKQPVLLRLVSAT